MFNSQVTVQAIVNEAIEIVKKGGASAELALRGTPTYDLEYRKSVFPAYSAALSHIRYNLKDQARISAYDDLMAFAEAAIRNYRTVTAKQNAVSVNNSEARLAELEAQMLNMKLALIDQAEAIKAKDKTIADLTAKVEARPRRTIMINGVLTKVEVVSKVGI